MRHRQHVGRREAAVGAPAALALVALDGGLELRRVREVLLPAFQRVQVFSVSVMMSNNKYIIGYFVQY